MANLLSWALEWAKQGVPVLPLHSPTTGAGCSCGKPDCGSVGKHPRTPNGLKAATTDAGTIAQWWGQWPDALDGCVG